MISLIRIELGLPFDEAHYLQIMNAGHEKMLAYLQDVTSDMSQTMPAD